MQCQYVLAEQKLLNLRQHDAQNQEKMFASNERRQLKFPYLGKHLLPCVVDVRLLQSHVIGYFLRAVGNQVIHSIVEPVLDSVPFGKVPKEHLKSDATVRIFYSDKRLVKLIKWQKRKTGN